VSEPIENGGGMNRGKTNTRQRDRASAWALAACLAFCLSALPAGCASQKYISRRSAPANPLAGPLQLVSRNGPQPTPRTEQLLRHYALIDDDTTMRLAGLEQEITEEPSPEKYYACAELSYVQGKRTEAMGNESLALELYGNSIHYAYWYLFEGNLAPYRNPYDPQFRSACDVYNGALEAAMRIVASGNRLLPGTTVAIKKTVGQLLVEITPYGRWQAGDFEQLKFVSDYEVQGLTNCNHTYGLGVPMIAVFRQQQSESKQQQYYPPGLSFPVTAFVKVKDSPQELKRQRESGSRDLDRHFTLELHDTVSQKLLDIGGQPVPLETDLTTPLAYFLDNPKFEQQKDVATMALRNPELAAPITGLFMLEPFDPNKIPVLMIHGLWSGPVTWMEMFNDLRSFPDIRDRCQFWFYLYPTGQAFWASARQLRLDLNKAFQTLDPEGTSPALKQMVLVGHSMGGLVAQMQTLDTGNQLWAAFSDHPFEELKTDDETRERLRQTLFLQPNPNVRHVITIATPHHGSYFANDYTRWLGRHFINLPEVLVNTTQKILRDNPGFFRETDFVTVNTSIDSLSPESPVLPVLLHSQRAPWTEYHNIIGRVPEEGFLERLAAGDDPEGSDGIVSCKSARVEYANSELEVKADHVNIHRNPRTILEVRRILQDHCRTAPDEIQQAEVARRMQQENPVLR
jgi:pimeloyl-ACP methyl ester carboxylesterase